MNKLLLTVPNLNSKLLFFFRKDVNRKSDLNLRRIRSNKKNFRAIIQSINFEYY